MACITLMLGFLTGSVRLLITEIMADPEPVIGLPAYEYIELFNAGDDTVGLDGWKLSAGSQTRTLPDFPMPPGSCLILCSAQAASSFRPFGPVLAVSPFPSLKNAGDCLVLSHPDGQAVHVVNYHSGMHRDLLKANGGWSLELTDPGAACLPAAWSSSADPSGGTPGKADFKPSLTDPGPPPVLLRAFPSDGQFVTLLFSSPLDPGPVPPEFTCLLVPGDISLQPASPEDFRYPSIRFRLPDGMVPGESYRLDCTGRITDCLDRQAALRTVPFGLAVPPERGDLVITEVMFDPRPGFPEYLEVLNRSGKVVDLEGLILARTDTAGAVTSFSDSQELPFILVPGARAVLTSSSAEFSASWTESDPGVLCERKDLPSLVNEPAGLVLFDSRLVEIDRIRYDPGWHSPYLDETRGISLERIDPDLTGLLRGNWISSLSAHGGGTPGEAPATGLPDNLPEGEHFTVDDPLIIPGAPPGGKPLLIRYGFDDDGWFLRLRIYDREGHAIAECREWGMVPREGIVLWDGLDSGGCRVPEGIYVAVAEYRHPSGGSGRWRRAVALVTGY